MRDTRDLMLRSARHALQPMDKITISDLEVFYRVGVPEEERAEPQRLLLMIEMLSDFTAAASRDDLAHTINYDALSKRLLDFGNGRQWKLIETLAVDLARMIIGEFGAETVTVEVKKFVISQARHVSVSVTRSQDEIPP